MPVANMWCTHTPKLMKPTATSAVDDPEVAASAPAGEHRDDHRDHARWPGRTGCTPRDGPRTRTGAGTAARCRRAPGTKNAVPKSRSSSSSAGGERHRRAPRRSTMNENTSIDHTKIGMRLSVMPGARILKIVTMKLTAPTVVEMPTKTTPRPQKSMLMPGRVRLAGERHVGEPAAVGRVADDEARVQEDAREAGRSSS